MVERNESELKEKLEYALQLFYDDVLEKKDLRHFFFGMEFKRIIEDYHLYKHFVMAKPERYYKEMVMQTAPTEIQVKAPQFDEILISLQTNMRIAGFLKTEIPKLSVHVIEVIEESRAQKSDAEVKVWKPLEVTNQLVCDYYNNNRTDARLEKNGDTYASRGFMYPFWTRVALDTKQIIFIGQAFAASSFTPVAELQTLCTQINDKVTQQNFSVREGSNGAVLFARHSFSYANGLPVRMLLRGAKQFASSFEAAINMDTNQLLVKKLS
jgi:hypothetical protein